MASQLRKPRPSTGCAGQLGTPPDWFQRSSLKTGFHDGITDDEAQALGYFYRAGRHEPELAAQLLQKPWARDDITRDEASVIRSVYLAARAQDESLDEETTVAAIAILGMPFLESVRGADASAAESLRRLERDDTARFLEVMSHPTLSDGITDEEAKIVALLWGTNTHRPESVDVLLGGTGVYVEERVIQTALSDEILLAVIRLRDHKNANMDYLEHAVRTVQEFMGVPLPTSYVAVYFDDAVSPRAGGTNFGTHIASKLRFDQEGSGGYRRSPFGLAHEVAHYYWKGNEQDWIDEGPAEFLGAISENARTGSVIVPDNNPCASAQTISELEEIAIREGSWAATEEGNLQRCHYYLGEAIFLDLYRSLGEDDFRQGFRNLYVKSQQDDPTDDCEGTDINVCHLLGAFKMGVSDPIAAQVDEIVARWYTPLP